VHVVPSLPPTLPFAPRSKCFCADVDINVSKFKSQEAPMPDFVSTSDFTAKCAAAETADLDALRGAFERWPNVELPRAAVVKAASEAVEAQATGRLPRLKSLSTHRLGNESRPG
jgi:hypothetical protein